MPFAFRFRIAFLAVAAHSAGSLLVAQDLASSGASASGCEVAPPTPDSTNVDVFMALGPSTVSGHEWYGDKRVLPPTQHRQLEAVLRSFRSLFPASALIPADLGQPLDVGDLDFVKAASTSAPSLRSRTTFTLHGDGRVSDVRIDRSSRSPSLDTALVSTLVALGADRALAGLQLDTGTQAPSGSDSLHLALEMGYWPNAAVATALLATIWVPSYEQTPTLRVPGVPHPIYPGELLSERVEGDVLVQLLIDANGRADMATVRVLKATHDAFAKSVLAVLPDFRFGVARINGCPAKGLVQIPFGFRLRR